MRIINYILISLLIIGCSEEKSQRDILNISSNVKSIKETSYNAVKKFGKIEKSDLGIHFSLNNMFYLFNENGSVNEMSSHDKEGVLKSKIIFDYNKNGKITEKNTYNFNGSIEEKKILIYNKSGVAVEQELYNSEGDLKNKFIYLNDENGNTIKTSVYDSEVKLIGWFDYKIGVNGKRIESKKYSADEKLMKKSILSYDRKGNMIEEKTFNFDGSLYSIEKFDKNENVIGKYYYGPESKDQLKEKMIFEYDEWGNEVKFQKFYELSKMPFHQESSVYKYNDFGDWVERIKLENKIPKYIVEREIIFFE